MDKKILNVQLKPIKSLLIPIDLLSETLFDVSKTKNQQDKIIEDKRLDIETPYYFEPLKGNLNQLDKLVFYAACSDFCAGNKVFTLRRLYQLIGGNNTNNSLTDNTKKMLTDSVERLACTRFVANMTQINERFHYSEDEKLLFKNYLLPCKSSILSVNGQISDAAFEIIDTPPLWNVAESKQQIISCDLNLLRIPKFRNTEQNIKIKSYLLERVLTIIGSHKKHKAHIIGKNKDGKPIFKRSSKLRKVILLDSLFTQCELTDATKRQRQEFRIAISKILNFFQAKGVISEWHFEKKDGKFHSISFDWKE